LAIWDSIEAALRWLVFFTSFPAATTFTTAMVIILKVENILKGSLDLIPSPSPSVKIQIMGGKVCLV
jgi:hypothetical protein